MKTVKIEGMMCSHCAGAVEKALKALSGVSDVQVQLEEKKALVTCNENVTDADLTKAVVDAGYTVLSVE